MTWDSILRDVPCRLNNLPEGWAIVQASDIVISKNTWIEASSQAISLFSVVVKKDFSWHITYGQGVSVSPVTPLLANLPTTINDISDVFEIVRVVDTARLCCGNNDTKYSNLREWKDGKFYDMKSKKNAPCMHINNTNS